MFQFMYTITTTIKAKVKNSVRFRQLIDGINKLHKWTGLA